MAMWVVMDQLTRNLVVYNSQGDAASSKATLTLCQITGSIAKAIIMFSTLL